MLKVNDPLPPGDTGDARFTRFSPHVVLPAGFCDCRLYEPAAHVVDPLLFIVIVTVLVCPGVIDVGGFCDMNIALLVVPPPVTLMDTLVEAEPNVPTPLCIMPHWKL
jgi:hypothetical protein